MLMTNENVKKCVDAGKLTATTDFSDSPNVTNNHMVHPIAQNEGPDSPISAAERAPELHA